MAERIWSILRDSFFRSYLHCDFPSLLGDGESIHLNTLLSTARPDALLPSIPLALKQARCNAKMEQELHARFARNLYSAMYCLASRFIQIGASVEGHEAWTHVHNATIRSWLIPVPCGPRKLSLSINEHSSRHSENFELSVEKRIPGICSRCEPLEGIARRPYRST